MNSLLIKCKRASSYKVITGYQILSQLPSFIRDEDIGDSPFIITSPRIGKLYKGELIQILIKGGIHKKNIDSIYIPDGERYKNLTQWQKALARLYEFDNALKRRVFIINLGGGVVSDLGGFVAACYKRGIKYVQLPTTLLGMVDCGVGGKTGVDYKGIKNMVGAIYQPALVFAEMKFLRTLPIRHMRAGFAEVIKYGVAMDSQLFSYIEKHSDVIHTLDGDVLTHIVARCYKLKAMVVQKDELDTKGIRAVLNYGHTLGHAIESVSKYKYLHGEAISIGMIMANYIAMRMGLLKKEDFQRCKELIAKVGLPTKYEGDTDKILDKVKYDKKIKNKNIRMVLIEKIGKSKVIENVPTSLIKEAIKRHSEL